eukprot:scaffold27367_cov112-Isochrysis_galbana.AAC.8
MSCSRTLGVATQQMSQAEQARTPKLASPDFGRDLGAMASVRRTFQRKEWERKRHRLAHRVPVSQLGLRGHLSDAISSLPEPSRKRIGGGRRLDQSAT